jgi:phage tail-like protein
MDAPFTGQFVFSVDGVGEIGAFTEVSGLSVDVAVEEVQEGGQNHFVHKLPGRMRWPNIVLKRGITDTDNLFEWFWLTSGEGFEGNGAALDRTNGEIAVLDAARNRVRSWKFEDAFPVKWTGPSFASSSSEVATEQLEIAHHGFRPA